MVLTAFQLLIDFFVLPIGPFYCQVEDFLADALDDSFSTYAEDGSPRQVRRLFQSMLDPFNGKRQAL